MPVAIITGASRGLGLELARSLAADGWNLVIDARDPAALRVAAERLAPSGFVRAIAGDVADAAHRGDLVAAATELGRSVVLMDGSFQFGDVGVLLNLNPKNKSIADLVPELEQGEPASLDTFVINHSSGVRVLLAPPSPEMAELITPAGVKKVIEALRRKHDLVIIDCTSWFNDTTLAMLDVADVVLTILSLEITSIKNMRLFLEVADQLGYEENKIKLVLNRADSTLGIRVADVENSIGRKVDHTIVSDGRSVVYALNRGVPFFLSNREAQVSQDILRLARSVVGGQSQTDTVDAGKSTQKKSLFAWR